MATLPSILSSSSSSSLLPLHRPSLPRSRSSLCFFPLRSSSPASRKFQTLVRASSAPSFGDLSSNFRSSRFESSKKSALSNLIHEIEPLDVSLIQKDVPPATVDAMKRTISGMLGLLPSDQFQVLIEALWEPLSKLLVSSMMTGYTLRNAEYRLCLKKNFDACEENLEKERMESSKFDVQGMLRESASTIKPSAKDELSSKSGKICVDPSKNNEKQGLGDMSPEAQEYIQQLRSQLSSVKKELHEVKRRSAALQMQQFVGEEKNDLLDYLRSLQPEKVAELSEPTSPELKEMIHSVVHGLLATLSPRMHSKVPPLSENTTTGTVSAEGGDCAEIVENTSLQFQPLILLTRDYLARLLFWCMLLGHYLRGLEYRMELMELLSLRSDSEGDTDYGKQAA
ncbi:uncharacterized protein LOC21394747 isoform X1 [Morus notabilis]|uniref:uncharacterized protein LOC21394747 isoform X1 n=1 Tax=Morus notabilis TaxID=981085 RepID=UPI000CED43E8|nr:uncharacterized protein LOC21394747 isoform X1 [Morus notabilis]